MILHLTSGSSRGTALGMGNTRPTDAATQRCTAVSPPARAPRHPRGRDPCGGRASAYGDPSHRFAEELPREEAWHGSREYCERPVSLHEGPPDARRYQFVARRLASALSAVGIGLPYRQPALVARERARRLRTDPDPGDVRFTRHGQLVMDWVEVFAPVAFEPHRPTVWPQTAPSA